MNNKKILMLVALIVVLAIAAFLMYGEMTGALTLEAMFQTPMSGGTDLMYEELQFGKNLDIWFMLMLVAFLMIFIKKFEWGVALAVLLSAAASFVRSTSGSTPWWKVSTTCCRSSVPMAPDSPVPL